MATAVVFPDRETLFKGVQGVLNEYGGTKITVRQCYYRLVAAGIIPNVLRSYKNVCAALADWRRAGKLPFDAFEDRTRGMETHDQGWREHNPYLWMRACISDAVRTAQRYSLAKWTGQEYRVIVCVEKQALEGPFSEVCSELDVDLVVCRGYPSLSFLYEIANSLDDSDGRDVKLLYFGDFDPSGLNIPDTIEKDLGPRLFGKSFELVKVALNQEQADEYDLIPAPIKDTDARAAGFRNEHGDEVYELDAIEPKTLQQMIRDAVGDFFDEDDNEKRKKLQVKGRALITELLQKHEMQRIIDDLDKESRELQDKDEDEDDDEDDEDGEEE